ncbi:uncharacterized protein VP01_3007g2 [Puccinia sorghi]|uniref:HAT C-terminal dimerisation domain-containing protein n=1 Tax=Puccinia sorghi TaxID=27349 RepID=A0A0L6V232_9BASI|nr:uncharacterized protein VP01_3007g2 [Puccinia sorghi]
MTSKNHLKRSSIPSSESDLKTITPASATSDSTTKKNYVRHTSLCGEKLAADKFRSTQSMINHLASWTRHIESSSCPVVHLIKSPLSGGRKQHFQRTACTILTCNVWTSPSNLPVFGVTAHWIDRSFELKAIALGAKLFKGNHSGFTVPEQAEISSTEFLGRNLGMIANVSTMWKSTFQMLNRSVRLKDVINVFCQNNKAATRFILSSKEWLKIKHLCAFLEPLNELTELISIYQHFESFLKD